MTNTLRKKLVLFFVACICSIIFQTKAYAQSQEKCKYSTIPVTQEVYSLCELFVYAIKTNNFDTLSIRYQDEELNDSLYSELLYSFKNNSDKKIEKNDIESFELLFSSDPIVSKWKSRFNKSFPRKVSNQLNNIEFVYSLKKEDITCKTHSGCPNYHSIAEPIADKTLLINIKGDMPQATIELIIEVYDSPKYGLIIQDAKIDVDRKPLYSKLTSVENKKWHAQNGASELSFSFTRFNSIELYIDGFTIVLDYKIEGTNMVFSYFGGPMDNLGIANNSGDYIGKGYFVGNNLVLEFTGLKGISKNLSLQNKQYTLVRD